MNEEFDNINYENNSNDNEMNSASDSGVNYVSDSASGARRVSPAEFMNNSGDMGMQPQVESRKFNFGKFLVALTPMLILLAIQLGVYMVLLIGIIFKDILNGTINMKDAANPYFYSDFTNSLISEYMSHSMEAYIVYGIIGFAVFALWYGLRYVKTKANMNPMKVLSGRVVGEILILSVGVFLVVEAYMILVEMAFPKAMESYNNLLEQSGLVTGGILSLICVYIVAPVVEELAMRGVTVKLLKWSGLSFWPCVIWSGVFFGILHMNVIQSSYAAVLGILLAYIAWKYGSIYLSIFTHILFNIMGTVVSDLFVKLEFSNVVYLIFGLVGIAITAVGILLVKKDPKACGEIW